ncbi:uncharacterized protein [Physcomitrium patens]|uniref:uncharacterized protein isoform X3 n=1 Tax=Physcomitrium patens TaxID=3218 RepID=UPI000D16DA1A|nr:probable ADP-ribosylation factor GTPase-activating protein AGD14 isoform X3 [Physcomitrium patens]|eukprot:XP_024378858.1 probable ADP-ribosylation factor GTPase-activating protein AGD14 isoform X3 [Physcomitrella patens]
MFPQLLFHLDSFWILKLIHIFTFQRAREFYFKELGLVRNPLPDSSDPIKLRNFINHVYVERRYTGDRQAPTKGHEGAGNEHESRRLEVRKPDLRSLSREDQNNDRRNNDSARKSDVEGCYSEKRSPSGFEPDRPPRKSYNDRERRRDEKTNPEASRAREKLPVRPFISRNPEDDGPPIRSVKEILGNDVPTLRVDAIGNQLSGTTLASVGLPNHARSQSLNHSGNGEAAASDPVVKRVSSESMISLIDLTADPEPFVTSTPASDPFAPTPATRPVVDTFAPITDPASTNVSLVDIFGSDPFAVAATAKPVADPFAPFTILKQTADPFGFGNPSASAATSSWATFDFTGNPAPPEECPGAFSASTATNKMTAQFSGSDGWNNSANSVGNVWSAFGSQTAVVPATLKATAPVPVATSSSQFRSI